MATVELKPISDLFNQSFFVPSYQRGYRWSKTHIDELLEDLYDFLFVGGCVALGELSVLLVLGLPLAWAIDKRKIINNFK